MYLLIYIYVSGLTGGLVVKNLYHSAGDVGSMPGLELRSHMPHQATREKPPHHNEDPINM